MLYNFCVLVWCVFSKCPCGHVASGMPWALIRDMELADRLGPRPLLAVWDSGSGLRCPFIHSHCLNLTRDC